MDKRLAEAAAERLPKAVVNRALARAVELDVPAEKTLATLNRAAPDEPSDGELENELAEAAQEALNAMTGKTSQGTEAGGANDATGAHELEEIIAPGLSLFGGRPKAMAVFGPKPPLA